MNIRWRCVISALTGVFIYSSHCQAAEPDRTLAVKSVNSASLEKRVALVIGNATYKELPLDNPANDATDIAAKLRTLGFDVVFRTNLSISKVGSTLREFRSKLTPGATALVFYAGHGLQIKGENYLPTVDADLASEDDVPFQSLSLRQLLELMEDSKTRTNLVFLDACRNNPYDRRFRSAGRGLAKVNAPSGTLIAYSTRPGSVASDGPGRNGLYTEQLLDLMETKEPIEQVLKRVLSKVKVKSQGKQEPWSEGSLEGDFCFGGCADPNAEKNALMAEITFWESVKGSKDPKDFANYLTKYPSGTFAMLAVAAQGKLGADAENEKRRQAELQRLANEKIQLEAKQKSEKAEADRLAMLKQEQEFRRAAEEKMQQDELRRIAEQKTENEKKRLATQEMERARVEQEGKERERLAVLQRQQQITQEREEQRRNDELQRIADEKAQRLAEENRQRLAREAESLVLQEKLAASRPEAESKNPATSTPPQKSNGRTEKQDVFIVPSF